MRMRSLPATSISKAYSLSGFLNTSFYGLKTRGFLMSRPFSTSRNSRLSIQCAVRFRPCIDIHKGKVKQIVGSTLKDLKEEGTNPVTNFESDKSAAEYANLYKEDEFTGGHVIMLGADPLSKVAALEALHAYPDFSSAELTVEDSKFRRSASWRWNKF